MRKCLESSSCRLYRRAHGVKDIGSCASEDGFILSIVNSSRGLGRWLCIYSAFQLRHLDIDLTPFICISEALEF